MDKALRILIILILLGAGSRACAQVDTVHWQNLSPLPSFPRIDYSSFVIDSNYYIIGGEDAGGNWYSEVWRYNIPNNSWQQMRDFPGGPTTTAAGFTLNGYGYICAGGDSVTNYSFSNKFWKYYPEVDTWQHKTNYPGVGREGPVSFVYGDYAFVGLGYGVGVLDMWRYSYASDNWDSVATIPEGSRTECGVVVIDSFVYIFGGFFINEFNDFWKYDINHDHWDSIGIMPGGLRANALFWSFDTVIIGGYGILEDTTGASSTGIDSYSLATDFYSYNIKTNKWDSLTCINFLDSTADDEHGSFTFGKTAYFFGGYKTLYPDLSFTTNMWSFDGSQFFPPDTTIGIIEVKNQDAFSVYPNPVSREQGFSVSTSESGEIVFYDALGRILDDRKLLSGLNQIKLSTDNEVIFYKATLSDGATENGKVVMIR